MRVLDPMHLFTQTVILLSQSDCPLCGRKDLSARVPGRRDSGSCAWCAERKQSLEAANQWLHRDARSRPIPVARPPTDIRANF